MMLHDEEFENYLIKHIDPEPSYLKEINRQTHLKVPRPTMLSGHIQGRLLSIISKLISPKNILEIGTYTGYSALCLAEGLQDGGTLITIDNNEELTKIQNEYISRSPYQSKIKTLTGDALTLIPKLDTTFDLVFIDADKINYSHYFDLIIKKMTPNSCLITDNVLWYGKVYDTITHSDEETLAIDRYNKKLIKDPRVTNFILPIRDGISICRVL